MTQFTTTTTCTCPSSQTTSTLDGITTADGCYCGPTEEEEEEPTTEIPMVDERDLYIDEFDEEIVNKMNLLRFY